MKNKNTYLLFAGFLFLWFIKLFLVSTYLKDHSPYNPWILGDEYIYINRARNIKESLSFVADFELGPNYPPLYSFEIAPAILWGEPKLSYINIKLINFLVSDLLFFLAFLVIEIKYKFRKKIKSFFFFLLSFFLATTLSGITGFYSTAMSENLFTPLIVLVFALFGLLGRKVKRDIFRLDLIVILIIGGLSILVKSTAISLLLSIYVTAIISLFFNESISRKDFIKKTFIFSLMFVFLTLGPSKIFSFIESRNISNYKGTFSSYGIEKYLKVIKDFLSGKIMFYRAFKILGNHLAYITMGSFFYPLFFISTDMLSLIKRKKCSYQFILLLLYGLFSVGLSFLHCYKSFDNSPVKYSTYARYIDPLVIIVFIYGTIRLIEFYSERKKERVSTYWIFALITIVALYAKRAVYKGVNTFALSWLDLFKTRGMLLIFSLIFIGLIYGYIKDKKKELLLTILIAILLMNYLSFQDNVKYAQAVARGYEELDPVINNIMKSNLGQIYVDKQALINHGSLKGLWWYAKYGLMFYTDEISPIKPTIDEDLTLKESGIILGDINELKDISDNFYVIKNDNGYIQLN